MIFNYDPIVGLVYTSFSEEKFITDISYLPADFDKMSNEDVIRVWTSHVKKMGISIIDRSTSDSFEKLAIPIYSNVPYELF